jgi:hypothetical protein
MSQFKPHAFPFDSDKQSRGMTLRDYFAAKAMAAFISRCEEGILYSDIAQRAYFAADAMLKKREEE